ncbi:MAG: AraC family transcriptional regulator, partial [Clostridia bacterium]|nr:AraC family transcriptional regulator [Clostridia bacterium]
MMITKLYEAKNHILIHAGYDNPVMHRHMAAHIIISANGKMCVTSGEAEYLCHGVMIPSGASHKIDTYGSAVLVFLYDCTTNIAKQIRTIRCIPEEYCRKIMTSYTSLEQAYTTDNYCRFEKLVMKELGFTDCISFVNDERIVSAMKYIRSECFENLSCNTVADAVHLSQSRFSHLFREQVGMTFSAYLIY